MCADRRKRPVALPLVRLKEVCPDVPMCTFKGVLVALSQKWRKSNQVVHAYNPSALEVGRRVSSFRAAWATWCTPGQPGHGETLSQNKPKNVNKLIFHYRMFLKCILPRFLMNLLRVCVHVTLQQTVQKPSVEKAAARPPRGTALLKTLRTSEFSVLPSFRSRWPHRTQVLMVPKLLVCDEVLADLQLYSSSQHPMSRALVTFWHICHV